MVLKCCACTYPLFSMVNEPIEGLVLKLRCPSVECRRRLTILTKLDRMTDKRAWVVCHTDADLKADGQPSTFDQTALDKLDLIQLEAYHVSREKAVLGYIEALEVELNRLHAYAYRRHEAERQKVELRKKLTSSTEEAKDQITKRRKSTDAVQTRSGELSGEAKQLRAQMIMILNVHVRKGKVNEARAAELIRKSNLPAGLDELADALKMPRYVR